MAAPVHSRSAAFRGHDYVLTPLGFLPRIGLAALRAFGAQAERLKYPCIDVGGFIVPGPELMVRSLLTQTSDLASHTAASHVGEVAAFADNTREAIERGCRVALAALVDRAHADLVRTSGASAALLVTGGAAGTVLPYVLAAVEHVPDLVLQGVANLTRDCP